MTGSEPAWPVPGYTRIETTNDGDKFERTVGPCLGLTKREWLAGLAMQGLCSLPELGKNLGTDWKSELTKQSVLIADAILAELAKPEGG